MTHTYMGFRRRGAETDRPAKAFAIQFIFAH
jgi:hypothetical protein